MAFSWRRFQSIRPSIHSKLWHNYQKYIISHRVRELGESTKISELKFQLKNTPFETPGSRNWVDFFWLFSAILKYNENNENTSIKLPNTEIDFRIFPRKLVRWSNEYIKSSRFLEKFHRTQSTWQSNFDLFD